MDLSLLKRIRRGQNPGGRVRFGGGACAQFYPSLNAPASTIVGVAGNPMQTIFTFRNGNTRVSLAVLGGAEKLAILYSARSLGVSGEEVLI
jgi:hypothetical protein